MSRHARVMDLLGPYAMGALGPAEEREVEGHLRDCPLCAEEARELRLAHEALLDFSASSEAPPQEVKDRVMDGLPSASRTADRRVPLWMTAVAAALCVLAVVGALYSYGILGRETLASATLSPTELAPNAGGKVEVYGAGLNKKVRVEAWGLPPCQKEQYYELWFVEGDERVSGGSFTVGESGRVEVELNAPAFAESYPVVGITYEKDRDPRPSDARMLAGKLEGFES